MKRILGTLLVAALFPQSSSVFAQVTEVSVTGGRVRGVMSIGTGLAAFEARI